MAATKSSDTPAKKAKTLNIYQKLVKIRSEFANSEVAKSGKNIHAEFDYFELSDILPVATTILSANNTLFLTTFPSGQAVGTLIDLDNPEDKLTFMFDTPHIKDPAKFRMNEAQACGAEQTYYRRYLYFQLLDIDPQDSFDGGSKAPVPAPIGPGAEAKAPKKPPTSEERTETKKALTATDGNADELQIKALKEALKKLKEIDPSKDEFIQAIAVKTEGFKKITRAACEKLIINVNEMIENYNINAEEESMWNG